MCICKERSKILPNLVGMVAFSGVGIHFLVEDITGSLTGHLYVFNNARLFCPLSLSSHPVDILTSYLDKDVL